MAEISHIAQSQFESIDGPTERVDDGCECVPDKSLTPLAWFRGEHSFGGAEPALPCIQHAYQQLSREVYIENRHRLTSSVKPQRELNPIEIRVDIEVASDGSFWRFTIRPAYVSDRTARAGFALVVDTMSPRVIRNRLPTFGLPLSGPGDGGVQAARDVATTGPGNRGRIRSEDVAIAHCSDDTGAFRTACDTGARQARRCRRAVRCVEQTRPVTRS